MAIPEPIQTFLMRLGFDFSTLPRPVADAEPPAAQAREWVETVAFVANHEPILAVVPGRSHLDRDRLQQVAAAGPLREPTTDEFRTFYAESEAGAMPPLGPFYGQRVFVDRRLVDHEYVVFSGGTREDAIRMRYADFAELVHPTVGDFATPEARHEGTTRGGTEATGKS